MHDISAAGWEARLVAFYSVVARRQTYRNALYLLSSFPLGAVYVALVVPGLMISICTAMLVGVPLLLLLSNVWWRLGAFERWLARRWLGVVIVPPERPHVAWMNALERLRSHLLSPVMWKVVAYLVLKFPLGVAAVVVMAALIRVPLGLLIASASYLVRVVVDGSLFGHAAPGRLLHSIGAIVAGLVLLPIALRLLNALAGAWGRFARVMLGVNPLQQQLAVATATAAREQVRAARAEQSRRELIVNVSHELRTPIASIRGHVESLLMATEGTEGNEGAEGAGGDGVVPGEQRAYLAIVYRETERLSALVDDLLALARADAGELRLELAPIAAAEVIEEVYGSMAPLAKRERRVTLVCDVAPGLPPVLADRQRLGQVVLNLVRNAVTYTSTGGIVSIGLHTAGPARLALTVADTGIGIPPEEVEHIFDRFYRTDASRARTSGGFGLGLAIVRDLVTAMGGSVSVESVVDKGSTFRLLLPIASSVPADRPV